MVRTSTDAETDLSRDWGNSPAGLVLHAAWRPVELALRKWSWAETEYGPDSEATAVLRRQFELKQQHWIDLVMALSSAGLVELWS